MSKTDFNFNFGPISRTLGPHADRIGFASLPIHEVSTALLGAQNKDEFIAWLWHDIFKGLFIFRQDPGKKINWQHFYLQPVVTTHYLEPLTIKLAAKVGISPDYIHAHQLSEHAKQTYYPAAVKMLPEPEFVSNEFEQRYLGEKARFVQLSFRCQPAANTLLLRLAVMEAFLQSISRTVADAIKDLGLEFDRIHYIFRREEQVLNEEQIASQYDLQVQDSTLTIVHFVPSLAFEETTVLINLGDTPPNREDPQSFSLSELLTVYRDDLTLIVALPLFVANPDQAVTDVKKQMQASLPAMLNQLGIHSAHKAAIGEDLIAVMLDEQVEVRPVYEPHVQNEPRDKKKKDRPIGKALHKLVARPYELMADSTLTSRCMICGSPIKGGVGRYLKLGKKHIKDVFSDKFTDFEHISLDSDACPMCLMYANRENRKMLRGALAFLSPSTSLRAPFGHALSEQPRFDQAGRFDQSKTSMIKTVVTLQELVLLTVLSRRILNSLNPFPVELAGSSRPITNIVMSKPVQGSKGEMQNQIVGKYLPYTGAYFLFDIAAVNRLYRTTFLGQELSSDPQYNIWQAVRLLAYPFEIMLSPSFTMLLELGVNADFMNHAGAHTLLKVAPTTVYLSPDSSFHVLVDNAVQETVNQEYIEALRLLEELAVLPGISRYDFINALLTGDDPITAAYQATERPKKQGKKPPIDFETLKVIKATEMSEREKVMGHGSLDEMWLTYIELTDRLQEISAAHPTLVHFVPKPRKKGA